MITKEQIKEASKGYLYGDEQRAFAVGAQWAAEKLQASIQEGAELIVKWVKAYEAEREGNIRLVDENTRLREALLAVTEQFEKVERLYSRDLEIIEQAKNALK